jgi:sulfatase maturation enzyme AslB (radical SAM superfamily)
MTVPEVLAAWWNILNGRAPMLSIEITRECPLSCPGCYAYGDKHLGDGNTLRDLSDLRGDALVEGVLQLVRKHRPLHVSLVGGEPLVRHRELSRILPVLSEWGVNALVVTSAVIPIPAGWMTLRRLRVAVSIDGLPEHHDVRRKPATYERILRNLEGRQVNVHWTITRPMLQRAGYLEEYVAFWNARSEVNRIWVSLYTPQLGEQSAEMLMPADRESITRQLIAMQSRYPKLLMREGIAQELLQPPAKPAECLFSKMSVNYSADLKTRVEPCIFGGEPDCKNCGCATTSGLEYLGNFKLPGGLKLRHLVNTSMTIGSQVGRLRNHAAPHRWRGLTSHGSGQELVQIESR